MLAQYAERRGEPGTDEYLERVRNWSRQRGQQAGCAHGEGFAPTPRRELPEYDDLLKTTLQSRAARDGLTAPTAPGRSAALILA